MWYQLYSAQFYYALHLFGALVFFAAGWLYLDAYTKAHAYLRFRIIGFFVLAVASLIEGTRMQFVGVADSSAVPALSVLQLVLPIIGYICIFLSFPFDPIQNRPAHAAISFVSAPLQNALVTLLPVGSLSVSTMYFIHVSEGLEWHLLMPGISFALIGLSEVFHAIRVIFSSSESVYMLQLIGPFGFFWWIQQITLLLGFVCLLRWVFWYLLKSFEMQMVFIAALGVSLLTCVITALFVYNLFGSLLNEVSGQVTQSLSVFSYSMTLKRREALADARFIAADIRLVDALKNSKNDVVQVLLSQYVASRGIRGLMVVNQAGDPVVKNDADAIFSDMKPFAPIVAHISQGVESATMVSVPGLTSPMVFMVASVPVSSGSVPVGSVLLAYALDSALTEGIKKEVGLAGAIFAQDRLSVTSMKNGGALIGMKETNPGVLKNVLVDGKSYDGTVVYNSTEYLGAYKPVMNASDTPVGMLYVGRPVGEVFALISSAISWTYGVSTLLLVCSIFPALYVAKYIIYQIR